MLEQCSLCNAASMKASVQHMAIVNMSTCELSLTDCMTQQGSPLEVIQLASRKPAESWHNRSVAEL